MNFKPEVIKYDNEGGEVLLEKRSIKNIFNFESQPYVCTAMSGKGKTTLAIDLIYTFAKQCSNVYYITATKESLTDDSISLIPKAFRREPSINNIVSVWKEIKSRYNAFNATPEQLNEIIVKIYGEQTAKQINDYIEQQKEIILERNTKMYKNNKYRKEEIHQFIKQDILAFCYELKRRIILFGYRDVKGVSEKLTTEQTNIVNSFVSKNTKSLLILDDITSELSRLKSDTTKVLDEESGGMISKATLFENTLTDILTRGRHYNCIIIFFVHTIDIFKSRENIVKLIMFDSSTIQKINGLKSFTQQQKKILTAASNKIFNNSDYEHMFLYYSRDDNDICVGKASLHSVDKLIISPDTEKFLNIYSNIMSGFKPTTQTTQNEHIEQDDYEEDEENTEYNDSII